MCTAGRPASTTHFTNSTDAGHMGCGATKGVAGSVAVAGGDSQVRRSGRSLTLLESVIHILVVQVITYVY